MKYIIACCTVIFANISYAVEPYQFVSIKNVTDQNVAVKLMTYVYQQAGIPIQVTPMTGSRALEEASSGRKDGEVMRVYAVGEKYPSLIRVPTPIMSLETVGFGIKGSNITVETDKDLHKYSIVRVRGVQHTKNLSEELQLKNIHVLPKATLFAPFLSLGRADLGITSRLNGLSYLKKSGVANLEVITKPLRVLQLYHYIHQDHQELVPVINEVLKSMNETGELAEIRARYEQETLDAI